MTAKKVPAEQNRPGFISTATGGHVAIHSAGPRSRADVKVPSPPVQEEQEQIVQEDDLNAFATLANAEDVDVQTEEVEENEEQEVVQNNDPGFAKASPNFEEVEDGKAHANESDEQAAIESNTVSEDEETNRED
jgi:HD-GYP domain-containing protein (c-di-GMP phosphodiesterase class II)